MENVNEQVVTVEETKTEKKKRKLTRKKIIALVSGAAAIAGATIVAIVKGKRSEDVPVNTEVYGDIGETIESAE